MTRLPAFLLATLVSSAAFAQTIGLRVAVLDVGQGDASVVIAPSGCAALFDGGPAGSGTAIKSWLKAQGVAKLDYIVTSHYHADHIGGIDEVDTGTDAVPVTQVIDRGGTYSSTAFSNYAAHYAGKRLTAVVGQTYSLCGEVQMKVVAVNANGVATTDENARSVAVKVSFGELDMLIGGDITGSSPDIESLIAPSVGPVELYKVHHHGSKTASNATFLGTIQPQNAFISVAYNNTYGHPNVEAVQRLQAIGAQIWQTEDPAAQAKLGNIEISSADGQRYSVRQGASAQDFVSKGVDVQPPTVPDAVSATLASSTSLRVAWNASTDDTAVAGYHLFWSGDATTWQLLTTTTATSFEDSGLPVDTDFWYRVSAFDANGNESAVSAIASARTVDLVAPSVPLGVAASAPTTRSIALSWQPSTDDVEVSGYSIYRDGTLVASPSTTSYTDAVGPAETHRYQVLARDPSGNASALSSEVSATTAAELSIPQKSFSTSTMYLYVKALYTVPNATLTAYADGVQLGTMIYSATYNNFTIRRKLAAVPSCITVVGPQGETATSCF